jgi:hypothetical protein
MTFAIAVLPKKLEAHGAWLGTGPEVQMTPRAEALRQSLNEGGAGGLVEVLCGPVSKVRAVLQARAESFEPELFRSAA